MKKTTLAAIAALLFINNPGLMEARITTNTLPPTPLSIMPPSPTTTTSKSTSTKNMLMSGMMQPMNSGNQAPYVISGGGIPFTNTITLNPYVTYGVAPVTS